MTAMATRHRDRLALAVGLLGAIGAATTPAAAVQSGGNWSVASYYLSVILDQEPALPVHEMTADDAPPADTMPNLDGGRVVGLKVGCDGAADGGGGGIDGVGPKVGCDVAPT